MSRTIKNSAKIVNRNSAVPVDDNLARWTKGGYCPDCKKFFRFATSIAKYHAPVCPSVPAEKRPAPVKAATTSVKKAAPKAAVSRTSKVTSPFGDAFLRAAAVAYGHRMAELAAGR